MSTGTIHTRNVIATYGDSTAPGILTIWEFSSRERVMRGVRTAALCLGITIMCVLIPIAHLFLVPLGLLLTPVIVWMVGRVRTKITSARVTCPQCSAELPVLTTQEKFPMYEICSQCHRQITLRKSADV